MKKYDIFKQIAQNAVIFFLGWKIVVSIEGLRQEILTNRQVGAELKVEIQSARSESKRNREEILENRRHTEELKKQLAEVGLPK